MGMDGETYKKRVIRMSTERGDFIHGDDGYVVFWPCWNTSGAFTPADLRILADHWPGSSVAWRRGLPLKSES